VSGLLISPILFAHQLRLVSTASTRPALARAAFQGVPADSLRARGPRYAEEVLPSVGRRRVARAVFRRGETDR
jgi:hypothetical protein